MTARARKPATKSDRKAAASPVKVPETLSDGLPKEKLVPSKTDWAVLMKPAAPPPGVLPKGKKLAMDSAPGDMLQWINGAAYNLAFVEGYPLPQPAVEHPRISPHRRDHRYRGDSQVD